MKTQRKNSNPVSSMLSLAILVIGLALMTFKIYEDSEPGAIPLILIIIGGLWYFFLRRLKASKTQ